MRRGRTGSAARVQPEPPVQPPADTPARLSVGHTSHPVHRAAHNCRETPTAATARATTAARRMQVPRQKQVAAAAADPAPNRPAATSASTRRLRSATILRCASATTALSAANRSTVLWNASSASPSCPSRAQHTPELIACCRLMTMQIIGMNIDIGYVEFTEAERVEVQQRRRPVLPLIRCVRADQQLRDGSGSE